jgi:hypothetical protein
VQRNVSELWLRESCSCPRRSALREPFCLRCILAGMDSLNFNPCLATGCFVVKPTLLRFSITRWNRRDHRLLFTLAKAEIVAFGQSFVRRLRLVYIT